MKRLELEGKSFGMLKVLSRADNSSKCRVLWNCQCLCGNKSLVSSTDLTNGHTKSCGCLKKKHGFTGTRLYNIYKSMKQRCYRHNCKDYKNYGARGIKICDDWLNNPLCFFNWAMANGYEESLTIDRINNDGDYEPSNCRWSTILTQSNNRRSSVIINHNGLGKTLAEWSRVFGIHPATLWSRINSGLNFEDCVNKNKARGVK